MMNDSYNTDFASFNRLSGEEPDSVIKTGQLLLTRLNGEEHNKKRAWIWYRMGMAEITKVRYEAAFQCLTEALNLHRSSGDERHILKDQIAFGILYCQLEQYEKAFDSFLMVRDKARSLSFPEIEEAAACNMGRICISQGRFEEGLLFLNSALRLVKETENYHHRAAILHEIGKVYLEKGELEKAAPNLEEALSAAKKGNDPFLYDYQVVLAEFYSRSGQYEKSASLLYETLEACRLTGKHHGEIQVFYHLGMMESARGNQKQSLAAWEECYQLTGELSELHYRILSGEKLVDAYMELGDSEKALKYLYQIRREEKDAQNERLHQTISSYNQNMRIGDLEREMQAWRRRSGELEQIRDAREESIRELEIIKDIGQQITGTLKPEEIVKILHDRLSELVAVDSLFISFYLEESKMLDFRYIIEKGKRLSQIVVPVKENESLSVYVIKNNHDLIINDRSEQAFYTDRLLRVAGTQQASESFIFVGLKMDGSDGGVLSVQAQKKHCYRERHLKVLQAVSGFVGVALSNAHSHQNLMLANKKIAHMATHDTLTGLPNRMQIIQHLENAIKRCERYKESLAVLFVDLDGFKSVNDSYGHRAGDALLIEMSKRLSTGIRATDYVGRLGGDEFLVILTDDCTLADGMMLAENLRIRMVEPFTHKSNRLKVSASIGLALYPDDGKDPESLVNAADSSMYDAKTEGKNRVAHVPPPN